MLITITPFNYKISLQIIMYPIIMHKLRVGTSGNERFGSIKSRGSLEQLSTHVLASQGGLYFMVLVILNKRIVLKFL